MISDQYYSRALLPKSHARVAVVGSVVSNHGVFYTVVRM